MDLSFLSTTNRVVNIVIKDHVIRYVELKQLNPPIVHKCGEHFLPQGLIKNGKIQDFSLLLSILEDCVIEWKIQRRQIRFLVPDPFIVIRKVTIPKDVKEDEIQGYLYLEMGTSIHLPFDEPVFDTVQLGETPDKKELLLFAAPSDIVSEYSSLFEACKLTPIAADISPLAIYRLYFLGDEAIRDEHLLLIQMDVQLVNASIFVDDKPIFMKHISIEDLDGKWEVTRTRTHEAELSYTGDKAHYIHQLEDTYLEIERVMNFYQYTLNHGQQTVTRMVITGDHPFLSEIISQLRERFDVPVDTFRKDYLQTIREDSLPYSFYLAGGLALKGVR